MNQRETAVDFAERQIRQIDQKIAELTAEKASILTFIQIARKNQAHDDDVAEQVGKMHIEPPQALSDRPGSLGRQLNRQIVNLSLEILRKKGEPMSAPDIHAIHPLKHRVSVEALYRLLYNRVVSRKLTTMSGAFWPIGEALPFGWESEPATSKRVESFQPH